MILGTRNTSECEQRSNYVVTASRPSICNCTLLEKEYIILYSVRVTLESLFYDTVYWYKYEYKYSMWLLFNVSNGTVITTYFCIVSTTCNVMVQLLYFKFRAYSIYSSYLKLLNKQNSFLIAPRK